MATHQMNLQPKFFNYIKNGTKRIELRLYDEKRRQIGLGDVIEFTSVVPEPDGRRSENTSMTATLRAEVVGLLRYRSFEELFEDFDINILADESMTKEELLATLGEFYPKDMQEKYGVVGIRIK
ncbi:ASCH domain-containing protein, partial [Candidatus Saccharibacteria bacterium]|nr:ASCH domain-containing protein [Candidatus Saccharibacteria bacterium]